jgi:hypothetical protein
MTSAKANNLTRPKSPFFGAIIWPLLAWLMVCAVIILLGPWLWNVPFIGLSIKAGEWLYFFFIFVFWLLLNCQLRRFGMGKAFLSFIIFSWLSAVVVWMAFVASEFHTVQSITSMIYGFVVYPACFALCVSIVGVVIYSVVSYVSAKWFSSKNNRAGCTGSHRNK